VRYDYDLVVIGSGPAGQKCAVQAAKLGKRVAVVERKEVVGGVAINTGTIPSKSLREAILHLSGLRARDIMGPAYAVKENITVSDLSYWCQHVVRHQTEVVQSQLRRNGIDIVHGSGSFAGPNEVAVEHGDERSTLSAQFVYISTGTYPVRPSNIPFDREHIVDADGILTLPRLPRSLIVVGGGVIGSEYASMMQALGVKVTLVEARDRLLDFLDPEIQESFQYHLRQSEMTLRLNERAAGIRLIDAPEQSRSQTGKLVELTLESDKTLRAECLLYAIGRQAATASLNLESVGIQTDRRGRLKVNDSYQVIPDPNATPPADALSSGEKAIGQPDTQQVAAPDHCRHIYAGGDVVGFPSLASTSMEQGRIAACHMFDVKTNSAPELFPFGIYAIPEMSMVGYTEQQLTSMEVPYESGKAYYREIARGELLGDQTGMLKLLVHQETRHVLGVHIIGAGATELVHIGQAVMALRGTVDYFIETVFNYPTLAECYKVAALNSVNKLQHVF
jgi:NAD(P) transhydrogenase